MDKMQAHTVITPVQLSPEILSRIAHEKLRDAERAWHAYAASLEIGPDRERAFGVFEYIRCTLRNA